MTTIKPGDYIADASWPGHSGTVLKAVTVSRRKWPAYLIELMNGERSIIFQDEALLIHSATEEQPCLTQSSS